jgi:cation-transporting ATPase E
MEQIVSEGRRDVNNITRSATLFLYKNIFSLLLAIFAIVNSFTYPLQPNQVSLISLFNIGMPAFLLALEPNEGKQEGRFILRTLKRALPASLTSFFSIAALVLFGQLFEISSEDISTASTYLLAVVGFMILWQISHPFNWYHAAVYAACIIGLLFSASQLKFIFALNSISLKAAALCAIFAIAEISVMRGMILFVDWMAKGRHLVLKKLGRI